MTNELSVEEAIELLKEKRMEINYKVNGTTQFSEALDMAIKALEKQPCENKIIDEHYKKGFANGIRTAEWRYEKIKAEIMDCLNALDEIEKSEFNIYLPNEISGRRLTYQQCLEFIDKYKPESEE